MPRLMLALSSRSPKARPLLDATARLVAQLQAEWFVVHVRQEPSLHYRGKATEHPAPRAELDHARALGAQVCIERGETIAALSAFAHKMHIDYFVTGRSQRPRFSFACRLSLAEAMQRKLPDVILIIV